MSRKNSNVIRLTSAEFLALLNDVQRSPVPSFSNNFFHGEDVTLDEIELYSKYIIYVNNIYIYIYIYTVANTN
jgi:hypothetical protein